VAGTLYEQVGDRLGEANVLRGLGDLERGLGRKRTGEDLPLEDFRDGENQFFSWGHDDAKDVLQSGPEDRDFTDPQLLTEISPPSR
jgi:hypothetical protein